MVSFYVTHRYRDDGAAPGNGTPSDVSTINVTVSDDLGGLVSSGTGITQELIVNGGFETGDFTGWTVSNSGGPGGWAINNGTYDPNGLATPLAPISGAFDAVSYQSGSGDAFPLRRVRRAPADRFRNATLVGSDPKLRNAIQRSQSGFRVLLHNLTGGWIQEVFSTQPGDPLQQVGPNHRSFDVTALLQSRAGQPIQLSFQQQDSLCYFNVTLDDMSLLVTVASAASPTVTVNNVAPSVTGLFLYGTIFENGSITLNNSFTDPGLLDQHTLIVDWDDPNSPADSTFALPATGTLTAGSTFASSTDSAVLTVYQLNAATGRVDFRVCAPVPGRRRGARQRHDVRT